ncbi:MAG: ATP-binding cassette domain-containing protein [Clostridiaceae bacterium]|nr:ATP-binding cassette domain-containing protein [Clostridiaceae bacterium]
MEENVSGDVLLQAQGLFYGYENKNDVLRDVSFSIREGERVAVLGANGAGKSTLFLNLNGVLTPSKGTVSYRGRVIGKKELNELRRHVGIVFQDADNQIIASSVLAEVSFGPMNLKLPKEEVKNRVEEALAYMNLSDFKDRAPHYLSGGEKKRVSIADIIAMKPEVIIFDEPTAALDPLNADMLEEVLGNMAESGKTILVSTHDVDFAYRWAGRILVFCEGRLIADGDPLDIFGNEQVLKAAHLKRPVLLEVYEGLVKKGMLPDRRRYPRQISEFRNLLNDI